MPLKNVLLSIVDKLVLTLCLNINLPDDYDGLVTAILYLKGHSCMSIVVMGRFMDASPR